MNAVPSYTGAQAGLFEGGATVVLSPTLADQVQPKSDLSMPSLMAQLAQVTEVVQTQNLASAEDTAFISEKVEPLWMGDEAPYLLQLPAMQSLWTATQASGLRNSMQVQFEGNEPPIETLVRDDMGNPLAQGPLPPAWLSPAPGLTQAASTHLMPDAADGFATVAELSMPALHIQGRMAPETFAVKSIDMAAPMPSQPVPMHKGPQALVQALADRVQVQQVQGAQIATVRLDPPQMGSLEIRIRQDASGVHVQMHASHGEVGRQLATVVDNLRQELLARSPDAHVTVSSSRSMTPGGQSGSHRQGQQPGDEPDIGQALQGFEHSVLV